MPYYKSGDLVNYITSGFYNISWGTKLGDLRKIIEGLINIHNVNIIHRDFHSENIFFDKINKRYTYVLIGDLGLSKSATESSDDNNKASLKDKMVNYYILNNLMFKINYLPTSEIIDWLLKLLVDIAD